MNTSKSTVAHRLIQDSISEQKGLLVETKLIIVVVNRPFQSLSYKSIYYSMQYNAWNKINIIILNYP